MCRDRPTLFFLLVVHTIPENAWLRKIIRETWGNDGLFQEIKHTVMFFMGTSKLASINQAVRREGTQYRDITVQDFSDGYDNLSLKSMMWLQWITKYCSHVEYVVKVEDLAIVNVYELSKTLREIHANQENGYRERFVCKIWSGMSVLRNSVFDWHVSHQEFSDDVYPDYCSGLGYIVGKHLLPLLHNASYYVPYFKVEDVYVTGMLKKYPKAQTHNIWHKFAFNSSDLRNVTSGRAIFGFAEKKDTKRYLYWKDIETSRKRYWNLLK